MFDPSPHGQRLLPTINMNKQHNWNILGSSIFLYANWESNILVLVTKHSKFDACIYVTNIVSVIHELNLSTPVGLWVSWKKLTTTSLKHDKLIRNTISAKSQ